METRRKTTTEFRYRSKEKSINQIISIDDTPCMYPIYMQLEGGCVSLRELERIHNFIGEVINEIHTKNLIK